MLNKRRVIGFSVVVTVTFIVFVFLMESDEARLGRAYRYDNAALCNLVLDHDLSTRCNAVISGSLDLCNQVYGNDVAYDCFYSVAIKKGDVDAGNALNKSIRDRCYVSYPVEKERWSKSGLPVNYTEKNNHEMCDAVASRYLSVFYKHLAYRRYDPALCNFSMDPEKSKCVDLFTGKLSEECWYYNYTAPVSYSGNTTGTPCLVTYADLNYCAPNDDSCHAGSAILWGNSTECNLVNDKAVRDGCFLEILDHPSEFEKL